MRFYEFVTENTQSRAKWEKSMIKKYGEDGWYDIADAVRDYYESNAILDNTISDIIKIKNDHPSFTDYSGITKLYRYEKKDKRSAPTDDKFIPFAYNIKGAKNFVQSMAQGNMGFNKNDFELVEKDFNPSDAILNFTNLIEMVHDAEDDDGDWYKREYEIWMKRTPYYTGTETNENFADSKKKESFKLADMDPIRPHDAVMYKAPHMKGPDSKMIIIGYDGTIGRQMIPFWKTKNGWETDEERYGFGAEDEFNKLLAKGDYEDITNENFTDGKNLSDEFLKSKFYNAADDCKESTKKFVEFMKSKQLPEPKVIWLAPPKDIKKFPGKSGEGDAHIMPIVGDNAVDFTAKQFGVNQIPFITPMKKVKQVYNKIGGYFTNAPDWVPGKTTHIIGTFNSLPQKALGLAENFADGKVKGKSRPGRVKRAGASCKGSVTSLRKRAKNASGEKAKMYHWCANMKSGRNK